MGSLTLPGAPHGANAENRQYLELYSYRCTCKTRSDEMKIQGHACSGGRGGQGPTAQHASFPPSSSRRQRST
eukprot:7643370-Pyramimonas_sp.AAC.1